MSTETQIAEADRLKLLKDVGIEWFKIHADQRLRAFNFFLIVAGFSLAAYFTAFQKDERLASTVIAASLIIVAVIFKLIDRRTAQLVHVGENLIEETLKKIDPQSADKNIVRQADNRGKIPSYRQSFNLLFFLFGLLAAGGVILPWTR
ncbi:MAG: hypothetical protein FD152_809 [Xanthobacteraceae bacterium]|nr:MAG: hypothetical protein FD152_809 [Xanthobacteraceae bacterium]